jgi:hypothetical protein
VQAATVAAAADEDLGPAGSKAPAAPTAEAMNSVLLDIPGIPDMPRTVRLLSLTTSSGLRLMEIRTGSELAHQNRSRPIPNGRPGSEL